MIVTTATNSNAAGIFVVESSEIASLTYNNATNVIGIVGEANWGPTDSIVSLSRMQDVYQVFGSRATGELVKYIDTIFEQSGGADNPGCFVWCKRASSDTGGAKADRSIAAGTDTTIDITAKYKGSFGNNINTQITAGSLSGTFNLTITVGTSGSTPWYYAQQYTNMTNDPADERYFLNVVKNDPYIDIAKTGTATTNPANDTSAVALLGGTNFTLADGNFVTALEDLKAVPHLRGIVIAKTTTSTLKTGLQNFSDSIRSAINWTCPMDTSTVAAMVAEMELSRTERRSIVYPTDFDYLNIETGLYEDQPIAWAVGITYRDKANVSPLMKKIAGNHTFGTTISTSDYRTLSDYGMFLGGYVPGRGTVVTNAVVEYRTTDNLTETVKSDISVVRKAIDIESDLDSSLAEFLGTGEGWEVISSRIKASITSRMEYWKSIGWLVKPYGGSDYYTVSFPSTNASTFPNGRIDVEVHYYTSATLRQIWVHTYAATGL